MQSTSNSAAPELSVKVFEGPEAVNGLAIAWDDLFNRVPDAPAYLSYPWINCFFSTSQLRGEVLSITVWALDKLVALLVISVRRQFGVRIASVIGTGMPSILGVLRDARYPEGMGLIANALHSYRLIDLLCIDDLLSCDVGTNDLLQAMESRGFCCKRIYRVVTHWIRLESSYEQYLMLTKSNKRRYQLKREEKNLFDSGGAIEPFAGKEITAETILRMARIQNEGWQKEAGANLLSFPSHIEIVGQMARAGMARAWILTVNGDDAAFVLAFVTKKQFHYYYTGYKTIYQSLSPGKTLTGHVIRFACEAGFAILDFGHSDQDYKRFWSTDKFGISRAAIGLGFVGRIACTIKYMTWRLYDIAFVRRIYRHLKLAYLKRVTAAR